MKKNLFRVHRSVAGLSRNSVQTIKNVDLPASNKKKTMQYRCEPAQFSSITASTTNRFDFQIKMGHRASLFLLINLISAQLTLRRSSAT